MWRFIGNGYTKMQIENYGNRWDTFTRWLDKYDYYWVNAATIIGGNHENGMVMETDIITMKDY